METNKKDLIADVHLSLDSLHNKTSQATQMRSFIANQCECVLELFVKLRAQQ